MNTVNVVSGAAGLIGFELCRELLARGERVIAVDIFNKGGREDLAALRTQHANRLEIVEADLALGNSRLSTVWSEPAKSVFHLAAIVGVRAVEEEPYRTIAVNLRSTLAMLDLTRERGCSAFFFASSSENYAAGVTRGFVKVPTPEDVLIGIDDPSLPRWSYAASKIAGESAVFAAARPGLFTPIVGRFHNVYGPRMPMTHVVPELLERCARKVDPFPLWGAEQTRSFLHVNDAARAVLLLAERATFGVVNIGSAVETRIADLAEACFAISGHRPSIVKHESAPRGSVSRRVPRVDLLQGLGFEPTISLPEGLRECWLARSRAR